MIGPLARVLPGLRVPGTVDGGELALRTIVGQQVSVAGARTVLAGIVAEHGRPITTEIDGLTHLFPSAETLAAADPAGMPMPRSRGRAVTGLAAALASGELQLDRGTDRDVVHEQLLGLPGVGPWTADYVALRALGHPDVFLPTDVGIRRALEVLGAPAADAAAWRPWRSYALLYLWTSLTALEEL